MRLLSIFMLWSHMSKSPSLATVLLSAFFLSQAFAEVQTFEHAQVDDQEQQIRTVRRSPSVKPAFSPFTGKIKGEKVRMRIQPDLESTIVRELHKGDLISIIDQEGEFYAVMPPQNVKGFVFRSFVIDSVVEGNRVNVRLEPDLEAPIIGHLNSGDRVKGDVSVANKKWMEIEPPANTRFYVAKDLIETVGDLDYKEKMDKRREIAENLFKSAEQFAKVEMEKAFESISFERIKNAFSNLIQDYADLPKIAEAAKNRLAQVQESYVQKRIAFLEKRASSPHVATATTTPQAILSSSTFLQAWDQIEDGLYSSWAAVNDQKDKEAYYQDQKMVATVLSGILEPYNSPVKNKPGDYILKNKNMPVAYVYSTQVDLQNLVGKKVTLSASPRPNHNFAFPAYFVHSAE